jgi:hypothetical protein
MRAAKDRNKQYKQTHGVFILKLYRLNNNNKHCLTHMSVITTPNVLLLFCFKIFLG